MNEQVARDVLLVRAIETADINHTLFSEDDLRFAASNARGLAQWQANEEKVAVTADHFLQQRAKLILSRLSERIPLFGTAVNHRPGLGLLAVALPCAALMLGAGMDRISDPHRIDLLSAPLLLILAWNLLCYVVLFGAMLLKPRTPAWSDTGLGRYVSFGMATVPRNLPQVLSTALLNFIREWTQLSSALTAARLRLVLHASAALFSIGAILSLYARGFLTQYSLGWESTFLNASQVHAILAFLFKPAMWLFGLPGFSLADIEALRFTGRAGAVGDGAAWVHLYAATLFIVVVIPRAILAAIARWRASRLAKHFPIDLRQPYFRTLGAMPGALQVTLEVFPYSFTVDEARAHGLAKVATMLLGEHATMTLRPVVAYGVDVSTAIDAHPNTETAVLFNLAATPENENHGAFLAQLVRQCKKSMTVLIDESGFAAGAGAQSARMAERIALWEQFCQHYQARAIIVNLIDPARRPIA
jgi:hypothetical protein